MKDKEFLEDVKKAKLAVEPVSGNEVGKIVTDYFSMRPALVASLKEILLSR